MIVLWIFLFVLVLIVIPLLAIFSKSVWLTLFVLGALATIVAGSIMASYRNAGKKIPWFAWLLLAIAILHIIAGFIVLGVESIQHHRKRDAKIESPVEIESEEVILNQ